MVDVIDGKSEWNKAIVSKDDDTLGFDLISPSRKYEGEKTRIFTFENISKLVEKISEKYDFILFRGFPEYQFIENMVLNKIVTDSIICVDAKKTNYGDLNRTIAHMNSEKLRGLVLVGT